MLEFNEEQQKQINYMKAAEEEEEKEAPAAEPSEDEAPDLDLFGNPINTQPKKPVVKPKTNAVKPTEPDKKYDSTYICLVYDKRIPVPEDGLSLEQIRAYLEMEFPQFGKERTEMMVDEGQKYIIPNVTKAPKKG